MSEWAMPGVIACPSCGSDTVIVNSRGRASRDVVHRQRECKGCHLKTSTFETIQNPRNGVKVEEALGRFERAIADLMKLRGELTRG